MVYLTRKTTRGQQYWYLVKSFKFNGRSEKVQHYLGPEEPGEQELERLKAVHGPKLELAAVERMAKASAGMFRTPYLDLKALKGLERLKFLRRVQNRLQDDPELKERIVSRALKMVRERCSSSGVARQLESILEEQLAAAQ